MTKIRLARTGSTHLPSYRVVVADSRSRRDGKFIEILGSYDPLHKTLNLKQDRAEYWISVGAQPTNTTISLLTKAGVKHPFTAQRKPTMQPRNPVEPKAKATPVEDAPAEAAEAPAEAAVEAEEVAAVETAIVAEADAIVEATEETAAVAEADAPADNDAA